MVSHVYHAFMEEKYSRKARHSDLQLQGHYMVGIWFPLDFQNNTQQLQSDSAEPVNTAAAAAQTEASGDQDPEEKNRIPVSHFSEQLLAEISTTPSIEFRLFNDRTMEFQVGYWETQDQKSDEPHAKLENVPIPAPISNFKLSPTAAPFVSTSFNVPADIQTEMASPKAEQETEAVAGNGELPNVKMEFVQKSVHEQFGHAMLIHYDGHGHCLSSSFHYEKVVQYSPGAPPTLIASTSAGAKPHNIPYIPYVPYIPYIPRPTVVVNAATGNTTASSFDPNIEVFKHMPGRMFVWDFNAAAEDAAATQEAKHVHYAAARGHDLQYRPHQDQEWRDSDRKLRPCQFCRKNGESLEVFGSHELYQFNSSIVTCPILRNFRCRRCGATGDDAHTDKYCPLNSETLRFRCDVTRTPLQSDGTPNKKFYNRHSAERFHRYQQFGQQ